MANNKDALNEMKRLAGLQLNEYNIAEAPKKSAAPAADDNRQYYRDPGDGGPVVPLGTKAQAGPGIYGDEKGRYDKMPGDNTRFFSTPGPEAAKPAPAAPAPAPKANVTKDQLDKFRQDTGNPNATLGQYLNAQQGKTARKGGANDPDVIQQKLGPGQDAYRPVPSAPAPQGKAAPAPATPAPLAPGGQFAPGSTIGLNPPAPNTPPAQMSRTPGGPEINAPIPGFGPNAEPVPPLKGPAGPDARSGSYPDRLPGAVNNTPAAPKPTIPQTGSDDYALGGGKDVNRPLLNPDRTIDAIKPSVPNFMKPLPSAPFDKNSTGGAPNMGGIPSAPVKPNTVGPPGTSSGNTISAVGGGNETPDINMAPKAAINPAPVTGGTGNYGKTGVPIDKITSTPGGASDLGQAGAMGGTLADNPDYPGYSDRREQYKPKKSMWDDDNHEGKDIVADDISRLKSLSGIKEDPINDKVGEFDREQMNKAATDARFSDKTGNVPVPPRRPDSPNTPNTPNVKDSYTDKQGNQHYAPNAPAYNADKQERDSIVKKSPPGIGMTTIESADSQAQASIENIAWLAGLR